MKSEAAEVHLLPPFGSIGCRGYPLLSVHDDGPQLGGSVGGQTRCVCIHPTIRLVPIQEYPFIEGREIERNKYFLLGKHAASKIVVASVEGEAK